MNYKDVVIKTKRLTLKSLDNNCVKDLEEILLDDEIKKTYMLPDFDSQDALDKMTNRLIELSNSNKHFFFGIFLEEKLIGFLNDVEQTNEEIEVGYVINTKYKNNGYCSEALLSLINYLFSTGLLRITAGAFEGNQASFKVMEKCGMRKIDKIDNIDYRNQTHKCYYYQIEK